VQKWRRGQIDCIESAIQTNPARITEALKLFRAWATAKDLKASETDYVARRPSVKGCVSAPAAIRDRSHSTAPIGLSPALSERKRETAGRESQPRPRPGGDRAVEERVEPATAAAKVATF